MNCTEVDDFVRYVAITEWENRVPDDEVRGFLKRLEVDLDLPRVAEQNAQGMDPRASLRALGAPSATMPKALADPQETFRKAIDARDFDRAWTALNSPGWPFVLVNRSLVVLQDLANDEQVALLARAWESAHTTWEESGNPRHWPAGEHVY